MSRRGYYALAVIVLLIAAIVRIWDLPTLPVGFSDLEIAHIDVMRDEVQTGDVRVFYQIGQTEDGTPIGQEGLYHLVLAGASLLLGEGTFGFRVLSMLIGMITVATIYTLAVRLFGRLVGLVATSMYSVMMLPVLLSRLVIVEAALPLMVAAVMLSLARALPVYARARAESSNTIDYATMGVLIALSLYLHQASLFLVLMAMSFVIYILYLRRPISLRRLSYIGFALLMLLIVAMPYFISTLRLSGLGANTRLLGAYDSITLSLLENILGLFWRGDNSAVYNLPQRPMMDVLSGFILLAGIVFCIRKWRNARYTLVLMSFIFLMPPAILEDNSPNFLAMSLLLPVIVLLFAAGAIQLIRLLPIKARPLALTGLALLIGFNAIWTLDSLFNRWRQLEAVKVAYHSDIGEVARHLDLTADDIPLVICNPFWDIRRSPRDPLTDIDLIKLHMNRDNVLIREVDCRHAFLFVNAGRHQQVLIADPMHRNELAPSVADWLALGTSVTTLPDDMVIEMQVQTELEDALGVFTTTSPASYATAADVSERFAVAPPIRFGGNVTWLGYETDPTPEYAPSMVVPVSTYWRIEGVIPSDLLIFTHLLADPVFPSAQVDAIYVNPIQLRERDVYLHNVNITLPPTIEPGGYVVSVGLYQETSDDRLPVFIDETATQGNRIFLYPVIVDTPESTDN